ncbi:hypothetical protein C4578_03930 [Candidatus Microgenomates bacterium]|jgi:hypothetical protein|nr:MAG: hypothetical protein C4578_03930 [Candidatus Microgenomates bacterium]
MTKIQKWLLVFLLVAGTFCQSLTMFRSGLSYDFGIGFWGANGHDGIWHLSLINQVFSGFPPNHPTFSGHLLTNYHYFYDLIIGFFNKLTLIPVKTLYFQVFPIFISLFIGILSFLVGYRIKKNFWTGFWFAFFNYFGGSFGYFVTLAREGKIGGESLFWSMQSISTQINPPFAFSLVLLLLGIYLLQCKKSFVKAFFLILIFGILLNVKAYAGVLGLTGLAFYTFFSFLKRQEEKKENFLIFGFATFLAFGLFFMVNSKANSLFEFKPLWFTRSLIESQDRLYLPQLALNLQYLTAKGMGVKRFLVEVLAICLFVIGNMGTRVIGFLSLPKRGKQITGMDAFLLPALTVGFLVPFFFVQKGTAWNTIQFFYYFLFFINLYAAQSLAKISLQKKAGVLAVCSVIVLTLPTTISSLKNYTGWPPPSALPNEEAEALSFLRKKEKGIVLTMPFNKYKKGSYDQTPLPLHAYESTAYVSAFSEKQTFLEDEMNLDISGYPWKERKADVEKFFTSNDPVWARNFLKENNIRYIYLPAAIDLPSDLGLEMIFGNEESRIYAVSDKI